MSRKFYPSDHRRWFRVAEDILDDPKLDGLDPTAFRFYFRLLATLNRMKSRDGKITIGSRGLASIDGRGRVDYAERSAGLLGARSLLGLSKVGSTYVLTVPMWPKHQGFTPTELRQTPLTTPTPISKPPLPPQKGESASPSAKTDVQEWMDLHNHFASKNGWPTVRTMKGPRLQKLRARLKTFPDLQIWRTVYERLQTWSWLGETAWRPTAAFLLRPDTVDRALEGEFSPNGKIVHEEEHPQTQKARQATAVVLKDLELAKNNAIPEEERTKLMQELKDKLGVH